MSITEMYRDTRLDVAALPSQAAGVAEQLASLVAAVDLADLDGEEAAELTLAFARVQRLGAAGKTMAAGQVAGSGYCRQAGFDTGARWLANVTKDNPWEAARAIQTAQHLGEEDLAETRRAFLAGELTATQANEIATAAIRSPGEQARLLAVAGSETMGRLRFECRKVRLADRPPPEPKTKAEDTAKEMSFGHREVGGDMSELFVRLPTSWLVLVLAAVRHQCDAVFAKARAEGREYPHQAYMVEALVTLLLIGGIDAPAGPFDDAEGEGAGGEAGPFDDAKSAEGPFDDAQGDAGRGDTTDGDGFDGEAIDGDEADDEAPGGGDDEDPLSQPRGPGGHPGATGAGPVDNDLLHDQLLAMLRGGPPPERPPRDRRPRGRCSCGGRVVPAARILVRVDHSALMRGYAQGDELCDLSGVGPVPVSTVRQLWPDAVVKAIITKGEAVANVTHLGRRPTEAMVAAMQFANPGCSNSTCDNDAFVEVDHRLGYANVGRTRLDELDLLCSHCHGLKTNSNWQLVAGRGRRRLVPPGHPDHPDGPATPRWRGRAQPAGAEPAAGAG